MSIFAEANSLVLLEEPVDDVFIEIKKADIRGGISAENVHIVSPYVGITQIRYTGRNAQFPLSLSASSPRFNYIFIIAWPSRVVNICPTVRSEEKGCSHLIFQYAGIVTLTNKDMTTVRSAF